ncbi:hypothetical protein E2C01_067035 [Portunus trituberculatus]|uniref:Uncharacterized protein n=1 Tax=Portunus trituberculatus TaxID=210409 RepID=A0A5B7HRL3_PORTR|nr:hypothetical protein [Portunus trituberculatus]
MEKPGSEAWLSSLLMFLILIFVNLYLSGKIRELNDTPPYLTPVAKYCVGRESGYETITQDI